MQIKLLLIFCCNCQQTTIIERDKENKSFISIIKLYNGKNVIIKKMSECQQNKQTEQPKRTTNLKFLSIKSIIRNKKIIVKKTVPTTTFYPRANNAYSTCQLAPRADQVLREEHSQRAFTNNKQSTLPVGNPNVVTIKFGQETCHLHKQSDHKIRKKFTNSFNMYSDDVRKTNVILKDKIELGAVEDSLIIQPLQKIQSHFGWDRKKGFYNYMLITKKNRKPNRDHVSGHETVKDFHRLQKATQTFSKPKKSSLPKQYRTAVSFMPTASKIRSQAEQRIIQQPNIQRNSVMNINTNVNANLNLNDQAEKVDRVKQKQITDILLKQYKQILPLRKPSNRKDHFVFSMSDKPAEPENKVQLYRDFIWKLNYSNGLFVYTPETVEGSYKAFIGFGNNSCMLKSILRRRSWWTLVESSSQSECNFVWTQLKVNSLFKGQKSRVAQLTQSEIEDEILMDCKPQFRSQQQQLNYISHAKIFNKKDLQSWQSHTKKNPRSQQKITEQTHIKRLKLYTKKQISKIIQSQSLKVYNHLQFNYFLGNKKALFYNIKRLCQLKKQNPFDYIPLTFHISKGTDDPVYQLFLEHYRKFQDCKKVDKNFRNIWICKPGENTNRGNGISVCSGLDDVRHRLRGKEKNGDGKPRTFILQKYIQRPFLYKNRKFDIRHYILLTCFNGNFKAFWFEEGYVRTSSSIFSLKNSSDLMVHLTNDAVQKKADTYGKHEKGNKVSYQDFQKYLDTNYKKKYDFIGKALQKMKNIARTAVEATYFLLDPNRKQHNFQLIGLDFMIDQNFKPWLIQANTNPCLELSSPLLEKLIPNVIEQTFRICVDPFFPPPQNWTIKNKFFGENALLENRFQLIFDERVDGDKIQKLFKQRQQNGSIFNDLIGKIEQDDELFQDDGNENWEQKNTN